jgi:Fungal Zn(2)-Cys(6) binuclear cluster domain
MNAVKAEKGEDPSPLLRSVAKNYAQGCYNCMKRRVICDRTEPKCQKCCKKGLDCPGFGIRYRFAAEAGSQGRAWKPKVVTDLQNPASAQTKSGAGLKWVPTSPARHRQTPRARPSLQASSSKSHNDDIHGSNVDERELPHHLGRRWEDKISLVPARTARQLVLPPPESLPPQIKFLFSHCTCRFDFAELGF